jgi:hypothetical protein
MATRWCTGDPSRERAKAWTDGAGVDRSAHDGGRHGRGQQSVPHEWAGRRGRARHGRGRRGHDAHGFDEAARGVGEVDEATCGRDEGMTMGLESRRVSRSGGVEDLARGKTSSSKTT